MLELQNHAALYAPKVGASLLILAAFWIVSAIVNRIILQVSKRTDSSKRDVIELLAQIARVSLLVFGTVTAVGTLGVNVSALVAGLGLTGFALGFAFRDALSNVLAGVLIVMYRPFLRGDHILVVGLEGEVVGVDLRYTTLRHEEKIFLIPNSTLFTNPITLTRPKVAANRPPEIQEIADARVRIGLEPQLPDSAPARPPVQPPQP
jgi:small conductance mechanosensitive channel